MSEATGNSSGNGAEAAGAAAQAADAATAQENASPATVPTEAGMADGERFASSVPSAPTEDSDMSPPATQTEAVLPSPETKTASLTAPSSAAASSSPAHSHDTASSHSAQTAALDDTIVPPRSLNLSLNTLLEDALANNAAFHTAAPFSVRVQSLHPQVALDSARFDEVTTDYDSALGMLTVSGDRQAVSEALTELQFALPHSWFNPFVVSVQITREQGDTSNHRLKVYPDHNGSDAEYIEMFQYGTSQQWQPDIASVDLIENAAQQLALNSPGAPPPATSDIPEVPLFFTIPLENPDPVTTTPVTPEPEPPIPPPESPEPPPVVWLPELPNLPNPGGGSSPPPDPIEVLPPPVPDEPTVPGNNDPLIDTPVPDQTLARGELLILDTNDHFTDPDADTLTFTATFANNLPLPAWLNFDTTTGALTGTVPITATSGDMMLRVTAGDGNGGFVWDDFQLTIPNSPPTLATFQDDAAMINAAWSFDIAPLASDIDGDTLTYDLEWLGHASLPPWISFDTSTGSMSGTPNALQNGLYDFRVTVTDGTDSVQQDFTLDVRNFDLGGTPNTDTLDASASAIGYSIAGLADNDTISGSDFSDTIYAGDGDDEISTGLSNNTVIAGNGNDTVTGVGYSSSNSSYVAMGNGDDSVHIDNGNDTVYGGTGNDTLDTGHYNDLVYGEDGDDDILSNRQNDTVYGGNGNDTIDGGMEHDLLYGGDGDDIIMGGVNNGRDTLIGGNGSDTLTGGVLEDIFVYEAADESTFVAPDLITDFTQGEDLIRLDGTGIAFFTELTITQNAGQTIIDHDNSPFQIILDGLYTLTINDFHFNALIEGTNSSETLDGTAQVDYIRGNNGNDVINGYEANDNLRGGGGNDTINGGDGDDYIRDNSGTNILNGDAGDDYLYLRGGGTMNGGEGDDYLGKYWAGGYFDGGDGNDTIQSGRHGAGTSTIYGGAGDDEININTDGAGNDPGLIYAEEGNDTVNANQAPDTIYGGDGNDELNAGGNTDTVYGDAGDDTLNGGDGNDELDGGIGNDTLSGGNDNDSLVGGNGTDTLSGGNDNDSLTGGDGADELEGGAGADLFLYDALSHSTSAERDVITDFTRGEDKIGLFGLGFTGIGTGAGEVEILESGGNTTISAADGGTDFEIALTGVTGLDASDIIFNQIIGTSGGDALIGTALSDYVLADDGNDTITAGDGEDLIFAEDGDDSVNTGDGNDLVEGGDGDDTVDGGVGEDTIDGGEGNNLLSGGDGSDTMRAGNGEDTLNGDAGDDVLNGGGGDDSLEGGIGNDTLDGDNQNDTLRGGDGDDELRGDNHDDSLYGDAGNDLLQGQDHNDLLEATRSMAGPMTIPFGAVRAEIASMAARKMICWKAMAVVTH
jgi:Ca2+-binding RTX toxin-like protein